MCTNTMFLLPSRITKYGHIRLFNNLFVEKYLNRLYFRAVVNKSTVNIQIQFIV